MKRGERGNEDFIVEHIVRELGEQVQGLCKIAPYNNDFHQGRSWGPKAVLLIGMYLVILGVGGWRDLWHRFFHIEWIPFRGNCMLRFDAKVRSEILGAGKDIIRRRKEKERIGLGSQV